MGIQPCALASVAALRARDVMEPAPLTVNEQESLASAWEVLARTECRRVPVVRGATVVGLLDDHALVAARGTRSLDGRQRLVGEFARAARRVGPDTLIEAVLPALGEAGGAVLVEEHGQVLGIVTCEHVVALLAMALPARPATAHEATPTLHLAGACVGSVVPAGPADA